MLATMNNCHCFILVVNIFEDQAKCPDVEEYFLDFIPVLSTTGLNLANIFFLQF